MPKTTSKKPGNKRRMRGFERASSLMHSQIKAAGQGRGFAQARLLTDWPEIVGQDIAAISRPVKVSYARSGFGATLILLTTGAQAPVLQAMTKKIRDRVNACYGYSAISHIKVTQTSSTGFAEGRAEFSPAPTTHTENAPAPAIANAAKRATQNIDDDQLAQALERLGQKVLSKPKSI